MISIKKNQYPDNWERLKLKDIAVKRNKKNKDLEISTVFSNSAIYGIIEQIDFFDKKIANRENLNSYFIVENDDFVYNPRISSTAPCGPINRNKKNQRGLVSPLYTVFRLNKEKCNLDYFEHYFKSTCWHKYMYSVANYGARADRMNITDSDFFNMGLTVPQLSEQQKIASILSTWDKAIELKEKLIEQKKEQKKGLMQKLLTGKIRFHGFEEEWQLVTFSKIFDTVTDYVANGSFATIRENVTYKSEEDYAILLRTQDYNNNFEGPFIYIDENAYKFLNKSSLIEGDIIISNVGAVGTVFKVPNLNKPLSLAPNAILVRSTKYNREFLYQFLSSPLGQNKLKSIISITAQPKFNKTDFKKLTIKIPSLKEQEKIAEVLSAFDREIYLLEKETKELKKQKNGLMQLLLTGKVRVQV